MLNVFIMLPINNLPISIQYKGRIFAFSPDIGLFRTINLGSGYVIPCLDPTKYSYMEFRRLSYLSEPQDNHYSAFLTKVKLLRDQVKIKKLHDNVAIDPFSLTITEYESKDYYINFSKAKIKHGINRLTSLTNQSVNQGDLYMDTTILSAQSLFDQYFKANIQLGLGDIIELDFLKAGINVSTRRISAQIGFNMGFTYTKILDRIVNDRCVASIRTHDSRTDDSETVYFYYLDPSDNIIGMSLITITSEETSVTTIVRKDHSIAINDSIQKVVKDSHHPCFILTAGEGGIRSTRQSIRTDIVKHAQSEFYPFLGMKLEEFYDAYLKSDATILLLVGPPGTGKSTFTRSLIMHSRKPASMVYDPDTLINPETLSHFYSSNHCVLGMEDADAMIGRRDEGNKHLAGYLNYADGVAKNPEKKVVISTNLSSLSKVDEALHRKGRCFAILEFKALTPEEANLARASIGLPEFAFTEPVVLADALNADTDYSNIIKRERVFGFGLGK